MTLAALTRMLSFFSGFAAFSCFSAMESSLSSGARKIAVEVVTCVPLVSRFLRPALLLLCFGSLACALDLKSLKPQGYVSDFAGVVDAESRASIETFSASVEKATGAQMSFVTLRSLEGEPLEDVSIDLFRQFGVGQKNKDNGVQLLLVTGDRRSRLEIGNGLEPVLPDGLDGQILVDMRPELQAGHYGPALLAAAQRIGQTIAQAQGVQVPGAAPLPQHAAQPHDDGGGIPWPLIVFGILILLIIFRRGGRGGGGFWPGIILGNMLGGGWGRGGGGFGGFNGGGGSSGGFGGFGGGDAGGGGASSSW